MTERIGNGVCVFCFFDRRSCQCKEPTRGRRGAFDAFASCFLEVGKRCFCCADANYDNKMRQWCLCFLFSFWLEILSMQRADEREKRAFDSFVSFFWKWGRVSLMHQCQLCWWQWEEAMVFVFSFFKQEILSMQRADEREKRGIQWLCKLSFFWVGRVAYTCQCQLCQWQQDEAMVFVFSVFYRRSCQCKWPTRGRRGAFKLFSIVWVG